MNRSALALARAELAKALNCFAQADAGLGAGVAVDGLDHLDAAASLVMEWLLEMAPTLCEGETDGTAGTAPLTPPRRLD